MKNKYLFLFCLLIIVFSGCSRESTKQSQTEPEEFNRQIRSVLCVRTEDILGDSHKEDSLLNWGKVQGFTEMNLYTVPKILRSGITKSAQVNDFVRKAHIYGLKVNFVAASSTGVNDIRTYCANYANKPDGIITEYEFWHTPKGSPPNSFATFKTILTAMTNLHNSYPSISRNAYVGKFRDDSSVTSDNYIIQHLIKNCETIFLTNYNENAYNYKQPDSEFEKKLKQASIQGKQLHKPANLIVLFLVNRDSKDPDIYTYFSIHHHNHPFKHAYNTWIKQYNAAVEENDDGLSIKGYAIFGYSDARMARP